MRGGPEKPGGGPDGAGRKTVNVPALVIGVSVAFWGWCAGFTIPGAALGALLEAPRFTGFRLKFEKGFSSGVFNFTLIVSLVFILYTIFVGDEKQYWFIKLLKWSPLIFYPLILVQRFSSSAGKISVIPFALIGRKTAARVPIEMDVTVIYFAASLFGAAAANRESQLFYPVSALLFAWCLYPSGSRRFGFAYRASAVLLVAALGFGVTNVVEWASYKLMILDSRLYMAWLMRNSQYPTVVNTKIGQMGELKLSDRIVYRVEGRKPQYLLTAAYDRYKDASWYTSDRQWRPIGFDAKGSDLAGFDLKNLDAKDRIWKVASPRDNVSVENLTVYSTGQGGSKGEAILPHPSGIFRITGLEATALSVNAYGTLKAKRDESYLRYDLQYVAEDLISGPPDAAALAISDADRKAVSRFIARYKLAGLPRAKLMRRLEDIFQNDYAYSLEYAAESPGESPISDFLNGTKSGHCEYFATATALILRSLGVESRYATGYSGGDLSPNGAYLVRSRHAHAWTLVWNGVRWVNFDTTPSSWNLFEEERASSFKSLRDAFSGVWFEVLRRLNGGFFKRNKTFVYGAAAAFLLTALVYRLRRAGGSFKVTAWREARGARGTRKKRGAASESSFYDAAAAVERAAFARAPWESRMEWAGRIRRSGTPGVDMDALIELIRLHYRVRFSADGAEGEGGGRERGRRGVLEKW
jgi:transglutaminase-like putative cysteine protease